MKKKTLTLCASAAFYEQLFVIEKELKKLGFSVLIPITARRMKKTNNYDVISHKTWYQNSKDYTIKTKLMKAHFGKVKKGDAILVVNLEKKGIKGYIGGNVLMEMVIAFEYKKPIYILNPIDEKSPYAEEIYGLNPVVINGD